MKRILIFSTAYFPLVGGAEVAMRELTDRLAEYEFDLITAAIKPGLKKEERVGNVRVFRVGFGNPLDKWLMPWTASHKAEQLHRENPYDAIWVLMASFAASGAVSFKREHPDIPMLLTLQEGDTPEFIARKTWYVKGWFRKIFTRADALQPISTFLRDWGISQGFSGKLIEVIPNGVDLERFGITLSEEERRAVRKEFGYADGDTVIITASRLATKNGVDILIKAMSSLPENVKLLIVGIGNLERKLMDLAKTLGVAARVHFAGLVDHDRLPLLLASSDIFCRPSRSEGMGNVFVEAMAAGLPVIGTSVGGITDVIHDGENGLLAEPESPDAVAEAVKRIMEDPLLRESLVQKGREFVKKYDWELLAERMRGLISKMLNG